MKIVNNVTNQQSTLEVPSESTKQEKPSTTMAQVTERPISFESAKYASTLMAERQMSSFAQEILIRDRLDSQLAKAPAMPQAPPTNIGSPGVGSTGAPQVGGAGLASTIQNELALGSKGPEVTILQTEMNKWLTKLGFDPIPDSEIHSGTFGPKTQEAVRLFQENHVIKQDGIVGPSTRDILALENNENFQKLDLNTQYLVKSQMGSYETPKQPEKREKLLNLATDPNFFECNSARTRQAILNRVDAGVVSEEDMHGYLELRATMAKDENFQKLSPEMQDRIDMKMEQTFSFTDQAKIHQLATEGNFAKLSESNQRTALQTLDDINRTGSAAFEPFMRIIKNASFPGLQEDVQTRILDAANRNGDSGPAMEALDRLVSNPLYSTMPRDKQMQALDFYLMMFPGVVPIG